MRDLTQQILNKLISTSTGDINGKIIDLYDKMNVVYNDLASTSTSYTKGKIADLYTKMNNIYNELNSTSTSYMKGKINAIYTKVHSGSSGTGMKFTHRKNSLIKTITHHNINNWAYFDVSRENNYLIEFVNVTLPPARGGDDVYSSSYYNPGLHIINLCNYNAINFSGNFVGQIRASYTNYNNGEFIAGPGLSYGSETYRFNDLGVSIPNISSSTKLYIYLLSGQRIGFRTSSIQRYKHLSGYSYYIYPLQVSEFKIYSTY